MVFSFRDVKKVSACSYLLDIIVQYFLAVCTLMCVKKQKITTTSFQLVLVLAKTP